MTYSPDPLIITLHHVSRFGYESNLSLVGSVDPYGGKSNTDSYSKGLYVNGGIIIGVGALLALIILCIYALLACFPCCRSCKLAERPQDSKCPQPKQELHLVADFWLFS